MLPPCGFDGGGWRMRSGGKPAKSGGFRPFECNARAGGGSDSFNKRMAAMRSSREPRSDAARNHQALVRAATRAVHREGPRVPMATIAADAGVGIGTLYRHFSSREDLLDYLTHVSFEQVLANAQAAERGATTAAEALRRFIEAAISQRNELVLPLHGGPPLRSPETRAIREHIHQILRQIIDRGRADGTIRQNVTPREIVVFGAMLAQPRGPDPGWDMTCRRLLATYLAGLGTPTPPLPNRPPCPLPTSAPRVPPGRRHCCYGGFAEAH